MIIGSELGIGYDPDQHAAYAASWIQILENQPLEIFRAAADGEKSSRVRFPSLIFLIPPPRSLCSALGILAHKRYLYGKNYLLRLDVL